MLFRKRILSQKFVALCILSLYYFSASAQVHFQAGYFVDENGNKTECLIKNLDWKNNPSEFEYKLTENSETRAGSISDVTEFSVIGNSRFIRTTVQIDRSLDDLNRLSLDRNPKFMEEELFLRVVLEGKASLYQYEDPDIVRFFYSIDTGEIIQLVYKRYQVDSKHINENNYFRQQIFTHLNCRDLSMEKMKNLDYGKKDLLNYMIGYNECMDVPYDYFELKKKQDLFYWSIRPGMKMNTINFSEEDLFANVRSSLGIKGTGFRLGGELEVVLPYNRNKWSIYAEPAFQFISAQGDGVNIDYMSIETSLGFRHYIFLNDRSKIFASASFVVDIPLGSEMQLGRNTYDIAKNTNFAFGIGYKYNNKYSFETRYCTRRDILSDLIFLKANFTSLEFIVGYTL